MTDEPNPTDVRMSYRDPLVERLRADGRLQVVAASRTVAPEKAPKPKKSKEKTKDQGSLF